MPVLTPHQPGDAYYPQFDVRRSMPINAGVSIVKGNIYTADSQGNIVAVTGSGGVAFLGDGLFQATVDLAAVTGESDGDRNVQFITPASYMILKADASLTVGNRVDLKIVGAVVTADRVQGAPLIYSRGSIGRIFRILSVDGKELQKQVTAANDLVVVRTGET